MKKTRVAILFLLLTLLLPVCPQRRSFRRK